MTKFDKVRYGKAAEAETIRKMIVAAGKDVRVLVIKLADRLHNMRTLALRPPPSSNGSPGPPRTCWSRSATGSASRPSSASWSGCCFAVPASRPRLATARARPDRERAPHLAAWRPPWPGSWRRAAGGSDAG